MKELSKDDRLKKNLGLFDVYAICTGAMFSSGFFLLPGLAAAKTGSSVALAYLVAGFLILPAMFSKAELSTALPRAGGTYYFLDRSLGPMFGTVGGLGTYLSLSLKTAFALIGIGAYASFFVALPIKPVAIALTVGFVFINITGAKETASLQRFLVVTLVTILTYFIAQGAYEAIAVQPDELVDQRYEDFLTDGMGGFFATVGFVFVSYAGLTKVSSVAEEVKNPERNIPLGMILSLVSTTLFYVLGVMVMVALIDPAEFHKDLTPVATAVSKFDTFIPQNILVGFVVIAALSAFFSTGNAGVMAASRYPMAMARDKLLPDGLAKLGKFKTPTMAVVLTGVIMICFILLLDATGIAKLASAFQLLIFMLVNLSVIVMRESRIESYDPGYKSPLYPWMQIGGMIVSVVLIIYMGWMAILFTIGMIAVCLTWYFRYARKRVSRTGAICHWFQRLGKNQYDELDQEFRGILKEKGLRQDDPFNEVVARAQFLEIDKSEKFEDLIKEASIMLAERLKVDATKLEASFLEGTRTGRTPVTGGVALPHMHLMGIDKPEMVIARSKSGMQVDVFDVMGDEMEQQTFAIFLLVSPEGNPGLHLRMLAELANRIDQDEFLSRWNEEPNSAHLKQLLLNDGHYMTLTLKTNNGSQKFIGKAIKELGLPEGSLVAMIQRGSQRVVPSGSTILEEADRLIIIGEPKILTKLRVLIES
ncbi:amino acid permease [Lentisphaera marina]|uniref:amino acid permease n=1 Tax=Lentisphaera marina TaxID=1111041 RepID=UPI0023650F6B|nr:amino acid permease [Lentisphaera marina]MDD7984093.1 amino acid permease [Lentisphaera marina]